MSSFERESIKGDQLKGSLEIPEDFKAEEDGRKTALKAEFCLSGTK